MTMAKQKCRGCDGFVEDKYSQDYCKECIAEAFG